MFKVELVLFGSDDGVSPDRVAQVMGQPDHCHHAAHLINELVQTAQVSSSAVLFETGHGYVGFFVLFFSMVK